MCKRRAFTLIELLIVIAIISILSAIALNNYLESQTRAKVAACKNDMRVLVTGLEAYATDWHKYPSSHGVGIYHNPSQLISPISVRLIPLTTPVVYISRIPRDSFPAKEGWGLPSADLYDTFDYLDAAAVSHRGSGLTSGAFYRLSSAGPDLYQAFGGRTVSVSDYECNEKGVDYDPTNGTRSVGDIVRVGPMDTEHGDPRDQSNPNRPGILRAPAYLEQFR
ncbi:MAG: prepilin-type N-terminal cleavage/methylation domain-containing protein [Candidatus Sumerlaeaceae bacterium]|nr:prepilin-type N-terminal cleavage/methylation domain-containing protein [Candidatus Sumerlaeaceae bacterium]